ncbi:MAG: hypothetical protein IH949_12260 [Bacteroidetes bacterium]|nr:hypothetical protein [Bacteroidota bacterium]
MSFFLSRPSAGKLVNPFSLYSFGIGKAYKRIFKKDSSGKWYIIKPGEKKKVIILRKLK